MERNRTHVPHKLGNPIVALSLATFWLLAAVACGEDGPPVPTAVQASIIGEPQMKEGPYDTRVCVTVQGDYDVELKAKEPQKVPYWQEPMLRIPDGGTVEFCWDAEPLPLGTDVELTILTTQQVWADGQDKTLTGDLTVKYRREAKVTWEESGYVKCSGFECESKVTASGGFYVKGPKGTRVTYGGKEATITGESVTIERDFSERIRTAKLAVLLGAEEDIRFTLPVTIDFPNGMGVKEELKLSTRVLLQRLAKNELQKIPSGPVSFGASPESVGRAILFIDGGRFGKLLGEAKTIVDVRYLVTRTEDKKTRSCDYYEDKGTERAWFHTIRLSETYTVYDRTTGKVVKSKKFTGKMPRCPKKIIKTDLKEGRPDAGAIKKWLDALPASL